MTEDDRKFVEDAMKALVDDFPRRKQTPRRYIGASGIGSKCEAALAFALRGFPDVPPDPQLNRIFSLGNRIEDIVVRDLRTAGIHVMEKDPMTGKQWNYTMLGGHIRCNLDGLIERPDGTMWNVEIKSMNHNKFEKFKEAGVAVSHPSYFDQMQMQMAMSKTKTSFFIAYNKNNSDYWIEIVHYDPMAWEWLKAKIESALLNKAARISDDPTDWRCRGCFKRGACWGEIKPEPQCYHCKHASAEDGYAWHCSLHDEEAVAPCGDYEQYEPEEKK